MRIQGPVTAVAFGPRGPIVATRPTLSLAVSDRTNRVARGRSDGSVAIRGAGGREQVLGGKGLAATAVAFSTDGTLLACGGSTRTVPLLGLRSRTVVPAVS